MYFYKFHIDYFDDVEICEASAEGYTVGCNYAEAVENLARFYGDDCIENLDISLALREGEPQEDVFITSTTIKSKKET